MNFSDLFNDQKSELSSLLKKQLNLSNDEIDTTIKSSEQVLSNAISKKSKGTGIDTLLNLFSESKNSTASNSFLKSIGTQLAKKLVSSGIGKKKSEQIVQVVLPIVVNFLSRKIGGDKNILSTLLGSSNSSSTLGKVGGLLGKFFKSLIKNIMAILKVIEILANSSKSWEEAVSNAVKEADKTLNNINSVNVSNFSVTVKDGKIADYRVNVKITFTVNK